MDIESATPGSKNNDHKRLPTIPIHGHPLDLSNGNGQGGRRFLWVKSLLCWAALVWLSCRTMGSGFGGCSAAIGLLLRPDPQTVDLSAWAPPDTRAARDADEFLREVSSREMVFHSLRTYYFSGIN